MYVHLNFCQTECFIEHVLVYVCVAAAAVKPVYISENIRVVSICKIRFKLTLFILQILFTERRSGVLNTIIIVERANEGDGEHGPSREAGHGAHWCREEVELDPDRIDVVVIAGGRGALMLTERVTDVQI